MAGSQRVVGLFHGKFNANEMIWGYSPFQETTVLPKVKSSHIQVPNHPFTGMISWHGSTETLQVPLKNSEDW